MRIKIEVDDRKLRREIAKLQLKLKDFKEALNLIAEEINEAINEAFAAKKSIANVSWSPWSETTKRVHGTRGSLLKRSGRLKRSIKVVKKNSSVSIEVRSPSAAVHQFGFPGNKAWGRGSAPIPARPYLPIATINDLHPEMVDRIEDILAQYFEISD